MREQFKKEIEALKEEHEQIEKMIKRLPFLEKEILERRYRADDLGYMAITRRYKDFYFHWDVGRYFLGKDNQPTNREGEPMTGFVTRVYINSLTLFDLHNNFNIFNRVSGAEYVDHSNCTFYIRDEKLHEFLESLNNWYVEAKKEAVVYKKEKAIREAEQALERAKALT